MEAEWAKTLFPGLNKKELAEPVGSLEDKWKLLPAFLKTQGLVKQHIDSYNYFVNVDLKQIMLANQKVTCEADSTFYLKYLDIRVGKPCVEDDMVTTDITPNECRLRDMTYAAPILVDIEYVRGKHLVRRKNFPIGRMPIMLKSSKCILTGKTPAQLAELKECPHDPGGYFIVKGQEKVILMQEQLSKNRIILELDKKDQVTASVTSSTHERKTKTTLVTRGGRIYMHHNTFSEDVPVVIVFKALGVVSDMEIVQLVGPEHFDLLAPSLHECATEGVYTELQALNWLGSRLKGFRPASTVAPTAKRTKADLAREAVYTVVISHVPVHGLNTQPKAIYLALMVRRILIAIKDPSTLDDRDYYGNKRLELAGSLLALLFEDLFKKFNHDIQRAADQALSKSNRVEVGRHAGNEAVR